jgi:predicted kinase
MKGLPASGKTTKAKELVDKLNYKRINNDDMRQMIDNGFHNKKNEKLINKTRDALLELYLASGNNVVVDNTHFYEPHINAIKSIAEEYGAEVEVQFIDTPLDVCIERDKKREKSVGAHVIRGMHSKYLSRSDVKDRYVQQDGSLPHAILVDIDGSVALINPDNPRSPFDNSRVSEDIPHQPVIDLVKMYSKSTGNTIIFLSGRKDECFEDTLNWLIKNCGFASGADMLLMRKTEDNRKDNIVKRELYESHVKNKFCVDFILDDRDQVCAEWRLSLRLPCFQVWYGDF